MTNADTTLTEQSQHTNSLADRIAEDYAPAWRPEPGNSVVGFVQEITLGTTDYGTYPIVTIVSEVGERVAIHAFHSVLKDGLLRARPSIGEEIAVRYNGKRLPKGVNPKDKGAKDKEYHDYRVIVNRAPEDIWGAVTPTDPRT